MEKATTISFHEGIATGPVRVNDISACAAVCRDSDSCSPAVTP